MDTSIVQLVNVVVMATSCLLLRDVYCQTTPTPGTDSYERVQVNSNSTNNTPTPDNLRVTFRFGSCNVILSLWRNPNVPPNAPVFVGVKGTPTRIALPNSEMYAHYIDPNTDASVLVKAERDSNGHVSHSFTGVFNVDNETYSIEPVPSERRKRRRRRGLRRMGRDASVVNELHLVHKENPQLDKTSPVLSLPNGFLKPPIAERLDPDAPGSNDVNKPPEKPVYIVELMVFVDYNIYKKMYDLSTASDKATDTLQRIEEYFGHIINGVDMRYRGINDSSFSVNIRLVGFYVAQDANQSAFIEKNRVGSGSSAYVAAQNAVYDFADWVNVNKGSLVGFDQASLFTSEYLNGANGDRISGLAFLRSMCTYYSVLLVRDSGEYGSAQTAAHELGHNLGAGHDGIDNSCNAYEQHIMVAASGPLTDAVYKNAYTFSSCSIDEMKSFLVTTSPDSCLQRLSPNSTYYVATLDVPLGQRYRPDAQCAILYGNGSFYCSGLTEDQQICRTMSCYQPSWQYCVTSYEQRAFSGTPCGNQKWCFMGDCVFNQRANTLDGSDVCMYGDSKAPFYDGFKCSNVTSQPWNCYKSTVANSCCRSCSAVRNDNLIGCEYGDQYPGCTNYEPLDCNDPNIKASCCKTCMDLKTRDCQSGDRVAGCSAADCLDETKYYDCCNTCASYSAPLPKPTSTATSITTTRATTLTTTPTTTTTATTSTSTTTSTNTPTTTSTPTSSTTTTTTPTTTATTPTPTKTTPTTTTSTPTTSTATPTTTTTTFRPTPELSQSCFDYDTNWCKNPRNFPPSNCYTSNMVYCCAFCYSIRDYSRPGCEYGDRYSWCNQSRCPNDDERKSCCDKCKDFLITSTATSTTTSTTTTTIPTTTSTTITTTTTKTTPTTTTTPTSTTSTPTTTTPTTTTPTTTTSTTTSSTSSTTTTTASPRTTKSSTATSTELITPKTTPTVGKLTEYLITTASSVKLAQTTSNQVCQDSTSVCKNMDPAQCYTPLMRSMCCKTCALAKKGPPGCEYGDLYMLCVRVTQEECYLYRNDCCRTCAGV